MAVGLLHQNILGHFQESVRRSGQNYPLTLDPDRFFFWKYQFWYTKNCFDKVDMFQMENTSYEISPYPKKAYYQ